MSMLKSRSILVYCDKCGNGFTIKPRTEKIDNDVERVYLACPRCKAEYTAYYTDESVRAKQAKIRTLQVVYNQEKDKNLATNLLNRMGKLKTEIGQDMEKLKKKYEG